jgi:hypothetical protein
MGRFRSKRPPRWKAPQHARAVSYDRLMALARRLCYRKVGMSSGRFHLEWILPLEPGLPTYATLHDTTQPDPNQSPVGTGGDEAEALLDLWARLTDQHATGDAIACVAQAYRQRTGHAPEGAMPDEVPPLAGAPVAPLTTDDDTEGG